MSKDLQSVQELLDYKTKEQCEQDWVEATQKAARLLAPFFKPMHDANNIDGMNSLCSKLLHPTWNGCDISAQNNPVPTEYIVQQQVEACKAFMQRIEELSAEVEDLQGIINN